MTIRQQGGIFGRNPKFSDVEVDQLQSSGDISTSSEVLAAGGNIKLSGTSFGSVLNSLNDGFAFGTTGGKPAFYPINNGSAVTNQGSIGTASNTLEYGYFGSGVFLGGAVSSNHLDDYEEGTFTPYFESSGATFNNNTFSGTYTKVGRLVHITIYCSFPTGASGVSGTTSNTLFIKGLPFTPTAGGSGNVRAYKVDYPTGDWLYPEIRTDNSIRLYMIRDNNFFVDWTAAAFDVVAAGAAMSFGLVGTYTAD